MNTCRILQRLVENVGIEPLFLFPKQECKTIPLRSPFGGRVIYPLTDHSRSDVYICRASSLSTSCIVS